MNNHKYDLSKKISLKKTMQNDPKNNLRALTNLFRHLFFSKNKYETWKNTFSKKIRLTK